MQLSRKASVKRRHLRVRKKVSGSAERPRLNVRKTLKHLYAQLIVDTGDNGSTTIASYGTSRKDTAGKHMCNIGHGTELGKSVGEDLKKRGIEAIVFDRGGYRYHGCVKAIADGIREAGIKF